ncbi:hypothetical protein GCM10023232_24190 [Sphingosinicella ginsenosidimutans]|jgi:hypothetical protein|uniref:Uncharacterized protein n=1 Tax=Allosphingosinicella ginsenosidimutans TaxID=1176539 RepID=A0A5C6TUR4_9SPHN|nr:hypothetical protein [Sphingosinicella ginsenosidimutans]TXC63635.1 hypothetical protein FRZ32_08165 [Sphingosinicella ginsenosidimutans]
MRILAGVMLMVALVGIALVGRGSGPRVDPPVSPTVLNHIAQKNENAARAAAAETRARAGLPPSPRLAANAQ